MILVAGIVLFFITESMLQKMQQSITSLFESRLIVSLREIISPRHLAVSSRLILGGSAFIWPQPTLSQPILSDQEEATLKVAM